MTKHRNSNIGLNLYGVSFTLKIKELVSGFFGFFLLGGGLNSRNSKMIRSRKQALVIVSQFNERDIHNIPIPKGD